MIPIAKGSPIPDAPDLVVMSDDGQYGDCDLIASANVAAPTIQTASFAAQYVRYGKLVYQFNTPEELGQAIVAIDPNSTHDAAQLYREELARDLARAAGDLTPQNQTPAPDSATDATPPPDAPAPDPAAQLPSTELPAQPAPDASASQTAPQSPFSDTATGTGSGTPPASLDTTPVDASSTPQVLGETTSTPSASPVQTPPPVDTTASTTPAIAPLDGGDLSSPQASVDNIGI